MKSDLFILFNIYFYLFIWLCRLYLDQKGSSIFIAVTFFFILVVACGICSCGMVILVEACRILFPDQVFKAVSSLLDRR